MDLNSKGRPGFVESKAKGVSPGRKLLNAGSCEPDQPRLRGDEMKPGSARSDAGNVGPSLPMPNDGKGLPRCALLRAEAAGPRCKKSKARRDGPSLLRPKAKKGKPMKVMLRISIEGPGRRKSSAGERGPNRALPDKNVAKSAHVMLLKNTGSSGCRRSRASSKDPQRAELREKSVRPMLAKSDTSTATPKHVRQRVGGSRSSWAASSTGKVKSGLETPSKEGDRLGHVKALEKKELPNWRESSTSSAKSMQVRDCKLNERPIAARSGTNDEEPRQHMLEIDTTDSICPKLRGESKGPS